MLEDVLALLLFVALDKHVWLERSHVVVDANFGYTPCPNNDVPSVHFDANWS